MKSLNCFSSQILLDKIILILKAQTINLNQASCLLNRLVTFKDVHQISLICLNFLTFKLPIVNMFKVYFCACYML